MNSQLYLYQINRYLAYFLVQVKLENQNGNFDINKSAEGFFVPILNIIMGKEFERLEFAEVNTTAIDLRSKDQEISIQVTSETGFDKIKHTLSRFISNKLYEKSKLIHLVIHEDYKTRKTAAELKSFIDEEFTNLSVSPIPDISFTKDDIWNLARLRQEIEKNCSVEQLKTIRDFLRSQYGNVMDLPSFNDVLIPYQVAFESELYSPEGSLPFLFNNPFFGREADLEKLKTFSTDDKSRAITIVADGGFGKTRLSIQFFLKDLDPLGTFEAFLFNDRAFNGALPITSDLQSKTIVILVDDAHRKQDVLESLFLAAKQHDNVKLILTIRKPLYDETVKALPSHLRNIPSIPLGRIGYEDTRKLIKSQLPGAEDTYVGRIAEESKGVPIVILGLCQTIREGKYSSAISEEENFIRFVRELKDQVIADISSKYYVERKDINKTIQLIALLGPIKNDEVEIRALSEFNGISFEDTSLILSYLHEHDIIQHKYTISILSDPYSDIILLDMAQRIKFVIQQKGIDRFIDRSIRNLVAVEHSERLKLDVDSVILEFINGLSSNKLESFSDVDAFHNNLETLKHFAYKKPKLVSIAIRNILKMTEGSDDFWKPDAFGRFRDTHQHIDTIVSILALNSHGEKDLRDIYDLVREIIKRRSDYNILARSFRYREFDFLEFRYRPAIVCERQQFLVTEIEQLLSATSLSDFDAQFIFTAASVLLKLDFSMEESFDKYRHTITHGTASVVDGEITKGIRDRAVQALIVLYQKRRNTPLGETCYDFLLRMLHFTVIPPPKAYILDQSSQIDKVYQFLITLMKSDASLDEKSKLNRQLTTYSRRETKEQYKPMTKELFEAATVVNSLRDKLELALRADYLEKRKNINVTLKAILSEYKDWSAFYADAISIYHSLREREVQQFNDLFEHLIANHPDRCKEMYELLKSEKPELRVAFSELIRANYKDSAYFYSCIDDLWAINTVAARQCVIYLLTIGRKRDKTQFEKRDFKYIETALAEGNRGAMFRLSLTLPDYIELDPDTTFTLLALFVDNDIQLHETEMLVHALFERKDFGREILERLRELAFKKIMPLNINSHYHSQVHNFLENNFGFDAAFSYLTGKLKFHSENDQIHLIDFSGFQTNPDSLPEQREDNLIKALEWFVAQPNPNEYEHSKIVDIYAIPGIFTSSFKTKIAELADKHKDDLDYLIKLCTALDVFEDKSGELIDFLIDVAHKIVNLPGYKKEMLVTVFGSDFVYNMGGRSKSGPGPFPQDVARRDELNELLKQQGLHDDVTQLFQIALRAVERSIAREIESDANEW